MNFAELHRGVQRESQETPVVVETVMPDQPSYVRVSCGYPAVIQEFVAGAEGGEVYFSFQALILGRDFSINLRLDAV